MILLQLLLWQLWEHFTGLLSNPQGNHCSHRHNKKSVVLTLVLSPSFNTLALVAVSGHKEPKKGKKSIVLKLFAFQGYIHLGKGSTSFQKYSLLLRFGGSPPSLGPRRGITMTGKLINLWHAQRGSTDMHLHALFVSENMLKEHHNNTLWPVLNSFPISLTDHVADVVN